MKMFIENTIDIENPSPEVLSWVQSNLIVPNPDYTTRLRMNFWLGNTPKNLHLYEVLGNGLRLPYGVLYDMSQFFFPDTLVQRGKFNEDEVDYNASIDLYDFQEEAVTKMLDNYIGLLQSPAGSGKTTMGLEMIFRLGKPALWLTHTRDLLNQSKRRALEFIDKSLIGTITEGKVNIGTGITFATVQTMANLDLPAYRHCWDIVIVDEAHRCSGSPTALTQFYKVVNNLAARRKYGLSATVHRADGLIKATYALLGQVAYEITDEDVGDKIMQVGIRPVYTTIEIDRSCLNPDGTLNYGRLITYLCEHEWRNKLIVSDIVGSSDHSCLILSHRLQHLQDLMAQLPEDLRPYAVMVSGRMTSKKQKAQREKALEDMRTGKKRLLFATYNLAKEGLDIPRLERLFLTTPQKDYAVITQSIGRIARIHPGKTEPICYDYVDDIAYAQKAYKKRLTTYRKNNCYEVKEK